MAAQEHMMMVRLPRQLHQAYARCVHAQDLTISQVTRGLLRAYLDARGVIVHLGQDDNKLVEGAQQ